MLSGEDQDNDKENTTPPIDLVDAEEPKTPELNAEAAIEFLQKTGYKVLTAEEVAAEAAKLTEIEETNTQLAETMQTLAEEMKTVKAQLKQTIAAPSGASNNTDQKPISQPQPSRFDALAAIWNSKMQR